MVSIKAHAQKKKKKASKNNDTGVKKSKKVIPKYEITRPRHIKSLKEPDIYPFSNQTILEDKFIKEYEGFMKFFLNTYNFLPREKLDNFLANYPFQTFQKNIIIRQKGNRRRKTLNDEDLEASFVLRWNWFLEQFESMLDDLPDELSEIAVNMIKPELSHFKRLLDYERKKEGKSRLRDNYLTLNDTPKF